MGRKRSVRQLLRLTTCAVLCEAREMKACEQCGGTGRLAEGAEMREKRLALGLTLQTVADSMGGKTRSYIHALEAGYGRPPMKWTADITARYERALATAVATRVTRSAPEQAQQRKD